MRRGIAWATALVAAGFAWWATGLAPFTPAAYWSLGAAGAVVVVAYARAGGFGQRPFAREYYRRRAGTMTRGGVAAWAGLAFLAAVLESVGLALGGRSPTVPTLSTVADHLLRYHAERSVLLAVWLVVGAGPAWRLARERARA